MNPMQRFALAAAFALSVAIADGAAFQSTTVVCLEDGLDEVCVGNSFFTTPSPADICVDPEDLASCTTVYEGGWTWLYSFIEGYEEGTDLSLEDLEDVTAAETGLVVFVSLDDDESTCEIMVGNETCVECSAAECTGFNVTYDCSNVEMGSLTMDCQALEPIFYPLEMFNETGSDDDVTEGGGDDSEGFRMSSAKILLAMIVTGAGLLTL